VEQRYAPSMASLARRQPQQGVARESGSRSRSNRSGRLLLRMPSELHEELSRLAERDGVSLNQLIVGTLSQSLADGNGESPVARVVEEPRRQPRYLGVALVVNLVVVALAGVAAVALLIAAWATGF
jgi:hypothetical protein